MPGRLIKLPLQAGNYDNFYSDGKKVWYASGRSTKVYDLAKQKEEIVAEGAYMDVAANHKKALFFKGIICISVIFHALKPHWKRILT